jgi:hypothetical protein
MSWRSRAERLRRLTPGEWRDAGRGVAELARARLQLRRAAGDLPNHLAAPEEAGPMAPADLDRALDIGRALDRAASIVPWRADCLVKALAAQHWLGRLGLPARIELGARAAPAFGAHAWVRVGDAVVVGGDTAPFAPLTRRN